MAKKGADDCVSSIAEKHGFFLKTLWDHPDNSELRSKRKDPNVLAPGDEVFVPEKRMGLEPGETEQRHCFKRKGIPAMLRLCFLEKGAPRSNVPYTMSLDGKLIQGVTDSDGLIEQPIPPDARQGELWLGPDRLTADYFRLDLGNMDPPDTPEGARKRLQNLGFIPDDDSEDELSRILREFQMDKDLDPTGELDDTTQQALLDAHGH